MATEREGVTKFSAEHRDQALETRVVGEAICRLVAWREIMALTGLVGQDPARYEGAGYGNVSARLGAASAERGRRGFVITGTQTSGRRSIGVDDFALVSSYDVGANRVVSQGRTPPSSESMTHGAIYDLGSEIRFVFHAHTPVIWRQRKRLRLPTTDDCVEYGTPEMAREVQRLYRESALPELRVLAMAGHEDGVISFGRSAEEAGQTMLGVLARAYEACCFTGASIA